MYGTWASSLTFGFFILESSNFCELFGLDFNLTLYMSNAYE